MLAGAAYPVRAASVACLLAGTLALSGCSKEAALRDRLGAYFALGDTLYYEQKYSCQAAVFRARDNDPRPALALSDDSAKAQAAFRDSGLAAVANPRATPKDLADAMLMSDDGALGRQVLAAAALVGKCVDDDRAYLIKRALLGRGNLLGYDTQLGGAFLLDRETRVLIFFAGDPV